MIPTIAEELVGGAMLSLAFSAAMQGIEGYVVRVEADSSPGSPGLAIIGLPDRALNEARERVRRYPKRRAGV